MSTVASPTRLPVRELADQFARQLIPLGSTFSYFSTIPLPEEEIQQYLHEPIAALPPALCVFLAKVGIILAPYLEKGNGKEGELAAFEKPEESRRIFGTHLKSETDSMLVLAVKDEDMADYHFAFYNAIAALAADRLPEEAQEPFSKLLREELAAEAHGEVDEKSWHLKQSLTRRQANARKETKLFRDYAKQSFEDTLTLYLHGICCDIDVETGPRQIASRHLRKRLELLESMFPPPDGYAVFPELGKKRR